MWNILFFLGISFRIQIGYHPQEDVKKNDNHPKNILPNMAINQIWNIIFFTIFLYFSYFMKTKYKNLRI
jgi:hypothetical protein